MLDEVTETAVTPAARPPINLRRVTFDKVMKSLRAKNGCKYECDNLIAKIENMEGRFGGLGRNILARSATSVMGQSRRLGLALSTSRPTRQRKSSVWRGTPDMCR